MKTPNIDRLRGSRVFLTAFIVIALASILGTYQAQADCVQPDGSATWTGALDGQAWDFCENWSPQQEPNGENDVATFSASDPTTVTGYYEKTLASIVFDTSAGPFRLSPSFFGTDIVGAGVFNNSGLTQYIGGGGGSINFHNSATASGAGGPVVYDYGAVFDGTSTASNASFPNGFAGFSQSSNAGNGTFINPGTTTINGYPSVTSFTDSAAAANGVFTCYGGSVVPGNGGGAVWFMGSSNAGQGTFTTNGATISGGGGGLTWFTDTSSATNATLIANGGVTDADAGFIQFTGDSTGGTARVEVFDNGYLNLTSHNAPGVTIGSLEGSGKVNLISSAPSSNILTIGSNNLSTTFSGVIQDDAIHGSSGSLTKIGNGKLTLANASNYARGTTVTKGTLLVTNQTGSATGTGAVHVNTGTLGGTGIISGAVTVGTGRRSGAILLPGMSATNPGTLTINSALTFNSLSTYRCVLKRGRPARASNATALGVTINSGASFTFSDVGTGTLTVGTVFTVMNNTSANPISGTFSNLPNGSTFTSNGNNFQASYTGGNGNDLTLTVVP